jgi:hypothetical protein
MNERVRVRVFESSVQSYLGRLWPLFGGILKGLNVLHRSSTRLELVIGLSLARLILQVALLAEHALLA